jgi:aminoglycoside 2''-phosphotransferase
LEIEFYRKAIEKCFPQIRVHSCTPIFEGWDNFVLEVNSEFIFRFPRRPDVEVQLEKEIVLLPELAEVLAVSVPRFEFVWGGGEAYPGRFAGYRKLNGVPLMGEERYLAPSALLAQQLSRFLSDLHRFPVKRAVDLRVPYNTPARWREEYERLY